MKKIRLNDSEGNILLPSTDIDMVENCPISKKENGVTLGSGIRNFEINSSGVYIKGKNIYIGGRQETDINGELLLSDATTNNHAIRLKDYPIDATVMGFSQLLGVVVPLIKPTGEYWIYPGFKLEAAPGASEAFHYYYMDFYSMQQKSVAVLREMDPNTQKFVPLGSKTLY